MQMCEAHWGIFRVRYSNTPNTFYFSSHPGAKEQLRVVLDIRPLQHFITNILTEGDCSHVLYDFQHPFSRAWSKIRTRRVSMWLWTSS